MASKEKEAARRAAQLRGQIEEHNRRYYQEASRRPGDTGENMIGLLDLPSEGALYLVRPDSYVALANSGASPERLRQYFTKRGWRRG